MVIMNLIRSCDDLLANNSAWNPTPSRTRFTFGWKRSNNKSKSNELKLIRPIVSWDGCSSVSCSSEKILCYVACDVVCDVVCDVAPDTSEDLFLSVKSQVTYSIPYAVTTAKIDSLVYAHLGWFMLYMTGRKFMFEAIKHRYNSLHQRIMGYLYNSFWPIKSR